MNLRTTAALAALLLCASFAFAKSAEQDIRNADDQWEKVFSAKDLDKSVAAVADDGSMLPPNSPIATGHDAVRKLLTGFFAMPALKVEWHATKAEAAKSGDIGYTVGTYEMSFKDASGKPMQDHGKYVTIWKKQKDGSWKVIYDIFNSDLAAPTT